MLNMNPKKYWEGKLNEKKIYFKVSFKIKRVEFVKWIFYGKFLSKQVLPKYFYVI